MRLAAFEFAGVAVAAGFRNVEELTDQAGHTVMVATREHQKRPGAHSFAPSLIDPWLCGTFLEGAETVTQQQVLTLARSHGWRRLNLRRRSPSPTKPTPTTP